MGKTYQNFTSVLPNAIYKVPISQVYSNISHRYKNAQSLANFEMLRHSISQKFCTSLAYAKQIQIALKTQNQVVLK